MTLLYFVLLLLAAVCFLASSFGRGLNTGSDRPINLVALGLFFWALVPLIQSARNL